MRPVYQFIEYRKYLDHFYQEQKRRKRHFSYRYFAKKAGLASHSFLKSVIEGKRNLTSTAAERVVKALDLNPKEARYFTTLVLFNQAKTAALKQEYYALLRSLSGPVHEGVLNPDQYDYYGKWQTPILRELVCLFDFGEDFETLGRAVIPPISAAEARRGVETLLKLGLVARGEGGRYRQTRRAIKADSAVTSLAVRSYMETVLDHAKAALNTMEKRERHLSSVTLGVSPEAYAQVVAEIQAFKDKVKGIVDKDERSARVYHLNVGLFPGSRSVDLDAGGPA